jgi:hypothetical protein
MLLRGKEALALPDAKESRAVLPASTPLAVPTGGEQIEEQNRQTARIFAGLMAASFLAGMLTRFFGPRKSS